MKILITYASAGSGHRQAAEAIYNYLRENRKTAELQIIDALDKTNPLFKNIYSYGYFLLVNRALWAWRIGFWLTLIKSLRPVNRALIFIINLLSAKKFAEFLSQENPDYIITTHFFPSEISSYLKKAHKINSKLITVITDFGVHPFWISEMVDIYITALPFTKEQLIRQGVGESQVRQFGIPVHPKFLEKYEKNILAKKLGIEQNKFTVLLTTGSFGIGPIEALVNLLYKDAQVLVVCARNKRLYAQLKYKNYPNVKIFGFIGYIQELMAVSDIIICKPGGLTISEALTMELAPIFISPIPGQEAENIKVLKKYGIGQYARRIKDVRDIVLDYQAHPEKLKKIKENIKAAKKPYAVKDIANVIC